MASLTGLRLLVVGASSGIGAAVTSAAASAGARVVGAARRPELVPTGAVAAVRCDVREPAACARVVEEAVAALGGLDALVYAVGVSTLGRVEELTAADWQELLTTNVVGAGLVGAAAVPAVAAGRGRMLFLSSDSVDRPFPGLVAYAASKAALDTLVDGWRAERPDIAFTRVVVGPTLTAFAAGWDRDRLRAALETWQRDGYLSAAVQPAEAVAAAVLEALAADPPPAELRVIPAGS